MTTAAAAVSNARPEAVQAARLAHSTTPPTQQQTQQLQYDLYGPRPPRAGPASPSLAAAADRDFNVKFIAGMEELTGGAKNKGPAASPFSPTPQTIVDPMLSPPDAPATANITNAQPRPPANMVAAALPSRKPLNGPTPRTTDDSSFSAAASASASADHNTKTVSQLEMDHQQEEEEEEEDEGCHPFWVAWWNMLVGCWLIVSGALTIPFVVGHGATKLFYSIPVMYGDYTIWRWPDDIEGFPSGVVAGFQGLFWGTVQGLTDWAVLPVRVGMKENSVKGVFKGIGRGLPNAAFKPLAGGLGFIFHPIFGIYKEVTKIDIDIRRDQPPRRRRQISAV